MLDIEPTLEVLNFATVVLRWDFGLLKRPPQVIVTQPEVLDDLIASFYAKAVFHSTPLPLNFTRKPIRLYTVLS